MDRVGGVVLVVYIGVSIGLGVLTERAGLGALAGVALAAVLAFLFTRLVRP